jgi:transcriptional regulator with XRE-family HTH domain
MADIRFGGSLPDTPLKLRLRELREARGLTHGQLAALAGCHVSTLTRLERGDGRPNRADLERFAAALGVTVEDLIEPEARR